MSKNGRTTLLLLLLLHLCDQFSCAGLHAADAIAVLKTYYLQLRAASAADPGALPVTARQLESLVRLSEARARVELREEVTRQDAEVGG